VEVKISRTKEAKKFEAIFNFAKNATNKKVVLFKPKNKENYETRK